MQYRGSGEAGERQYGGAKMVSQILSGDSFQSTLVAVVVPDHEALSAWAQDSGVVPPEGEPGAASLSWLRCKLALSFSVYPD